MFISGIVAAMCSILIIYPSLRAKGLYFLLVTLSLNQVITIGISNWSWVGGPAGILNIPPPNSIHLPWGAIIEFSHVADFYYLLLALSLLIVLILYRLWSGYLGKIIRAINTSEALASSLGIPTLRYKILVVVICCFVTGIMGSFSALFYGLASPGQFGLFTSFYPIVFGIVGGISYFAGPIIGTVFLVTLPEIFRFAVEYQPLIYAAAVILVMLLFRNGIIGLFAKLINLVKRESEKDLSRNNL
jgi:branched-chain amino acid transport system permease protein